MKRGHWEDTDHPIFGFETPSFLFDIILDAFRLISIANLDNFIFRPGDGFESIFIDLPKGDLPGPTTLNNRMLTLAKYFPEQCRANPTA
jgi:hypothetical protein